MSQNLILSLSALLSLIPVIVVCRRENGRRDALYWALLAVAVAGPLTWAVVQTAGTWRTGLSTTLWITAAASMAIFAAIAVLVPHAWRLTSLVVPYMLALGLLATAWQQAPGKPLAVAAPAGWIQIHIFMSVTTYALVTIAALAGLAAFLQERALKSKHPTGLTRLLPSVADCEALMVRLLILGEVVLGLGLATGMATQYGETGVLLALDHKTVLTITSFAVIGWLLVAHFRSGVRGRLAARLVLLAYLLMTLGYPGVKFVTDVLVS